MSTVVADLRANYAPVSKQHTDVPLDVEGHLPQDLSGTYLRNGPNRAGSRRVGGLWFDGQGMVHAVRVEGGRAWYTNRWVETPTLASPPASGRGEPVSAGLSVVGRTILALGDAGRPWRISSRDLSTDGPDALGADVTIMLPHVVVMDGRPVTIGSRWDDATLTFLERDGAGRWCATRRLVVARRPFLHDLAVAGDRLVVLDLPWRRGPRGPIWEPRAGATIMLAGRFGGEAATADVTPTFVSHLATAWSEGRVVHVVGCRRQVPGIAAGEDNPFEQSPGSLRRWSIDTVTGHCDEVDIDGEPCDFPVLLPGTRQVVVTRPHGRNYTVARGISVIDLATGRRQDHGFGPGRAGGELVPFGAVDGRTLIGGFVHDAARGASEVVVLDAADVAGGPIASLRLPVRVPYGLHGLWLPA